MYETFILLKPLIRAGEELAIGDSVTLRPDQATRLAEQGVIAAPASPRRARAGKLKVADIQPAAAECFLNVTDPTPASTGTPED